MASGRAGGSSRLGRSLNATVPRGLIPLLRAARHETLIGLLAVTGMFSTG
jgi:hypothetical protein